MIGLEWALGQIYAAGSSEAWFSAAHATSACLTGAEMVQQEECTISIKNNQLLHFYGNMQTSCIYYAYHGSFLNNNIKTLTAKGQV